jgi:hypothetical protein
MRRIIVGFVLGLCAGCALCADIVETVYPGNRAGVVLDAELLKVGIAPAIGGRIVEFVPKAVQKNYLHLSPWNFPLGPADAWDGGEYGGMCDTATGGWPGPFWGIAYAIERLNEPGVIGVRATAAAEGIGIQREMVIPNGTSRLIVRMRQTNLASVPQKMVLRLHGEFRVGTQADAHDTIFWKDGETLRTRQYIPGSENPRLNFDTVTDDWMAMVDTVEKEVLIHRLVSPSAPHQVFFWSGHPVPPPGKVESTGDTGFYNNERFVSSATEIAPNGAMEAVEEFWALRGLTRVDFCTAHEAGALEMPRLRYGARMAVPFTALLAAPAAGAPAQVTLTVRDAAGTTVGTLHDTVPAVRAGQSSAVPLAFATANLPDGRYTATAVFARDGQAFGTAQRSFEIVSALVHKAATALAAVETRIRSLNTQWRVSARADRWRLQVLQVRLDAVRRAFDTGEYEAAIAEALRTDAALSRMIADRQRERAPEAQPPVHVQALLKEYASSGRHPSE